MEWLVAVLASLAYGFGSAVVFVLNAEVYVVAAVAARPMLAVPLVLALSLGQTIGKVFMFEAARRGSQRFHAKSNLGELSTSKWAGRIQSALTTNRTSIPLVFAAASIGLPPLALVSVAAGVAGQDRRIFAILCFVGRVVRFAVIAAPIVWAATHR